MRKERPWYKTEMGSVWYELCIFFPSFGKVFLFCYLMWCQKLNYIFLFVHMPMSTVTWRWGLSSLLTRNTPLPVMLEKNVLQNSFSLFHFSCNIIALYILYIIYWLLFSSSDTHFILLKVAGELEPIPASSWGKADSFLGRALVFYRTHTHICEQFRGSTSPFTYQHIFGMHKKKQESPYREDIQTLHRMYHRWK